MTDVPRTSPERPIIWSPGRPATGSRRRPVDVPIQNFCIFVFPVKNSNRCVKQGLLHLKNTFFIKSSIFVLVPLESLECPHGGSERQDLQETSPGRLVSAGSFQWSDFEKALTLLMPSFGSLFIFSSSFENMTHYTDHVYLFILIR